MKLSRILKCLGYITINISSNIYRKIYSHKVHIKILKLNNLNTCKKLEKEGQTKTKASRNIGLEMKIRVEITIIENRKTRGKNNKAKCWFLEKIISIPVSRFRLRKKARFKFVKSGMKEALLPSSQNFLNIKKRILQAII